MHNHEDEMLCPYCDHQIEDAYEYVPDHYTEEAEEIECPSCEKTFLATFEHKVEFTTKRKDCPEKEHDFSAHVVNIDKDCIERWDKGSDTYFHGKKPHAIWKKKCSKCEVNDSVQTEIGDPCPWKHVKVIEWDPLAD